MQVPHHASAYVLLSGRIECGEGFVEHPQRLAGEQKAGEGRAPALTARKQSGGLSRQIQHAHLGQRMIDLIGPGRFAAHACKPAQVLPRAEVLMQAILVTEIRQFLAQCFYPRAHRPTTPGD